MNRTIRKCPHCNSTVGFTVVIKLMGYQYEKYTFSGKGLDIIREGTDDIEKEVRCLDCERGIDINKVKYKP